MDATNVPATPTAFGVLEFVLRTDTWSLHFAACELFHDSDPHLAISRIEDMASRFITGGIESGKRVSKSNCGLYPV